MYPIKELKRTQPKNNKRNFVSYKGNNNNIMNNNNTNRQYS